MTSHPFPGNGFIIGTIASNHYKFFLSLLVQSPWNADPPDLDPILQRYFSNLSCSFELAPLYRCGTNLQKTRVTCQNAWREPHRKHGFLYCCESMFAESLPSNGYTRYNANLHRIKNLHLKVSTKAIIVIQVQVYILRLSSSSPFCNYFLIYVPTEEHALFSPLYTSTAPCVNALEDQR
jgi:hypothetical protein